MLAWINESTHLHIARVRAEKQLALQLSSTLHALHGAERELIRAESNQLGYGLTGDTDFVQPYYDAGHQMNRLQHAIDFGGVQSQRSNRSTKLS